MRTIHYAIQFKLHSTGHDVEHFIGCDASGKVDLDALHPFYRDMYHQAFNGDAIHPIQLIGFKGEAQ